VHAEERWSSPLTSALIVAPLVIVRVLAPWVGRTANAWGRRLLLLIGLGVVPVRATLLALTMDPALLVVVQMLDGLSGATLGVLTTLVIADLAKGTGRFNLAQGLVGTVSGIDASLSTSMSGIVVGKLGYFLETRTPPPPRARSACAGRPCDYPLVTDSSSDKWPLIQNFSRLTL